MTVDPFHTSGTSPSFNPRRASTKRDAFTAEFRRTRSIAWTTRFEDILSSDADVVVEAIGAVEPATDWIRAALTAWVAPAAVPASSLFAAIIGPRNAAIISGEHAGETEVFGTGADATAVAAIGDLLTIAGDRAAVVPAPALTTPGLILGIHDACDLPEAV